jgi:dolichol-phosphate mannosyltransferase
VFNEADTVEPLVSQVLRHGGTSVRRVILIDDGSTDGSAERIAEIASANPQVESVRFAENRGKTAALAAGFALATGDIVITMDSDLQDDPAEIPRFVEAVRSGLDLVCGWKKERHDPWTKRWASRLYNGFTARVFGLRLHDINCGFKAMRIEVARGLVLNHDYHRLLPVIAHAQGFRVDEIVVRHHPRAFGRSKFGFERYWRGLRDVARLWWEIRTGQISGVDARSG